jgi:hypothetical protein
VPASRRVWIIREGPVRNRTEFPVVASRYRRSAAAQPRHPPGVKGGWGPHSFGRDFDRRCLLSP